MKKPIRKGPLVSALYGALLICVLGTGPPCGQTWGQEPSPPPPTPQPFPSVPEQPPPAPQPAPAAPQPQPQSPQPQPAVPASPAAPVSKKPAPGRQSGPPPTPQQVEGQRLAAEGYQLLQQGEFDAAEGKFKEALGQDPQNVTANTFLGFLAFRRGDLEAASRFCGRALDAIPQTPLALLLFGRAKEAAGDTQGTKELYAQAAQAGASSPTAQTDGGLAISAHAHYLKALQEEKEGNNLDALADLEETLRVFPKNVNAQYEKGLVLLALGRNEEAADAFGHAISDRSGWYAPEAWLYPLRRYFFAEENSHYWRGVALHRAGRLQDALNELSPLAPLALARMGSETPASAGGSPSPAQALEGEMDLSYYDTPLELARVLAEMGERGRAVDTLRSLLKLEHMDPVRLARAKDLLKEIR